ncbi:MAG: YcjX family protein [Mangrovicoccus sp.]
MRGVEDATGAMSEAFLEPVVRLGVTGLSRAGKTVFITSLVANLLDRGRMPQLSAAGQGRILTAYLQPQPSDMLPRFAYEDHRARLSGPDPQWPESTRAISELRLSFRVQPHGLIGGITSLGGLMGPRTVHLDIVDYPGEWLLDLALLEKSYSAWSEETLARIENRAEAEPYLAAMRAAAPRDPIDEPFAQKLAETYASYLQMARQAGYSDCTPGRFLLPGDLAGSPVLTFAPLPPDQNAPRRSLWREMERRYEAYKSHVVRPFFRDHFAKIDRQVVLVDVLGALHDGPKAVEDLRLTLRDILQAFRPGSASILGKLLGARRVEKILFAATKADHLHHSQHAQLTAIMEALVRDARDRAAYAGAQTSAMALAALRATIEETRPHQGRDLDVVRGRRLDTGTEAAFYPGALPQDAQDVLAPARSGAEQWLAADYQVMRFAPPLLKLAPETGPPHIRLDRAAQFLFGDKL